MESHAPDDRALRLRIWCRLPMLYLLTLASGASLLPLSMSGISAAAYGLACSAALSLLGVAGGLTAWSASAAT